MADYLCKKYNNMELNINEIKEFLSNRHPYLLVDRVTNLKPGVSAKAYKNLTANEWYFPVHFPEEPMMPGMIQMEALLQTLSLTVLSMEGNKGRIVRNLYANKIRLKKRVTPGNRLDIEAELTSIEGDIATGCAKGFIDGEPACEGEFKFKLI